MISFQSDFDCSNEYHLERVNDSFPFYEEDIEHQEIDEQCVINNPLSNNILEEVDDLIPKSSFDLNLEPITELENHFTENISNKKTKPITETKPLIQKTDTLKSDSIKDENNPQKLLGKKKGRKQKNGDYTGNALHNKKTKDNIMRKIKTHLIEFFVKLLNSSLKDKTYIFYKIDKEISEKLKRDFNIQLIKTTLRELFLTAKVNARYKKNGDSNRLLVEKIFKEKIEEETMALLRMTYIEMVVLIREKYLQEFLATIERKEVINEDFEEYMNLVKELLFDYENWFENKKGRNRKSKKKKIKNEKGILYWRNLNK